MRRTRPSPVLILATLAAGCVSDTSVDASYSCVRDDQCARGFRCVDEVCRIPIVDKAESKAPDAGPIDAGAVDTNRIDAGDLDAGSVDAGPDPCGTSTVTGDAGLVPVYCALHRTLVVDGDLSDWAGVPFTALNRRTAAAVFGDGDWTPDADTDDADLSGAFALQWDSQYLYIAGALVDDVRAVHASSDYYANDDCFQIYLDGDHNRSPVYDPDDLQLLVRADNAAETFVPFTTTVGRPSGVLSATQDGGSGGNWNIEIAIPWSMLSPPDGGIHDASPGRVVGFDLIFDDDDDAGVQTRKHYLIWQLNPTGSFCPEPYCSTSAFGDVVLTGAP
jgi:hypothetical protein